jgi:hypothetical protein
MNLDVESSFVDGVALKTLGLLEVEHCRIDIA